LIDWADVVLVVLVLRHDFSEDVVLALELVEPVREERLGTDEEELTLEAQDLERAELDVEADRLVPLRTGRGDGSDLREVDDAVLVLIDAGAEGLSLNREAFSCK
jgi:hypothetical protein